MFKPFPARLRALVLGALASLSCPAAFPANAARLPANLAPFDPNGVCVGRADVQVRGKADAALASAAQEVLKQLAASQKLGAGDYTSCPAWLFFTVEAGNAANGGLVYAATLSLVAPKVRTSALESLRGESFDYDGGFEFVTLWSETGFDTAADAENLRFKLRAAAVSGMDAFKADWARSRH